MPIRESELKESLYTGFIAQDLRSRESLQPQLITNDWPAQRCVLDIVLGEITNCDSYFISAAFLTKSGVAVLLNALVENEVKGITGRLLVSEYLCFTQPEALKALRQFDNIDVRIATSGNMHGKAFIFETADAASIIIGSSNLTAAALKTNNEINLKVTSKRTGAIYEQIEKHLQQDFNAARLVDDNYIEEYEKRYRKNLASGASNPEESRSDDPKVVEPNDMQREALEQLQALRERGECKGLIISATGTGKTLLSAFDVKACNPKKVLFVVHRKNIALAAMRAYKLLFGTSKTYGIFSGTERKLNADIVFSTIQTISKDETLSRIDPAAFEYVIIDETHRAGADSYQKLIEYLQPEFLLGMTATPERTDGHDIFADFDHNIAYEIRLHRAMETNILSPFHYFGVTDISVDGDPIDDLSDFNALVSEERVNHILEQAKRYGCDSGDVRGLIFCSRKTECIALSKRLNQTGLNTLALTGEDSEPAREAAIKRLEADEDEERLHYIITVDIFNEGIDIPRVNQILMLRPTSSAIIFIQQLGRGLRKVNGKDYLTVIDFIGNYQNNYLIPIALYGDTSYNKDRIRRLINSGSNSIPGSSTINFDRISKEKIYASIDKANMSLFRDLKNDYKLLKFQLGRTPMMMDFIEHGGRDPFAFVSYSKSYLSFVIKVDGDFECDLSNAAVALLSAFSREINNGKRVEDSIALRHLIVNGETTPNLIAEEVSERFGYRPDNSTIQSVFQNISLKFVTDTVDGRKVPLDQNLGYEVMELTADLCKPGRVLGEFLMEPIFRKFLLDTTNYSINKWSASFAKSELIGGFILYEKYSRKDVFRILNWQQNPVAQNVGGYLMNANKEDCAIFVNYDKHDHSESTQYVDEFIDESQFKWMSKNRRRLTSPEIVQFQQTANPTRLPLFVKKSNDEGTDFYYLGELTPILTSFQETTITNDDAVALPVVSIHFNVLPHIENSIYKYITTTPT